MYSNSQGGRNKQPNRNPETKRKKTPVQSFDKRFSAPCFSTVETTICLNWMLSKRDVVSSFCKIMHLESRASTSTEELHHQLRTAPEREGLLVSPVQRLREQLQVEVPQELSKQETHLGVRKAVDEMLANTARYSSGKNTDGVSR